MDKVNGHGGPAAKAETKKPDQVAVRFDGGRVEIDFGGTIGAVGLHWHEALGLAQLMIGAARNAAAAEQRIAAQQKPPGIIRAPDGFKG